MKKNKTLLLYGSSEEDANLFYATKFFVPDPIFFIQNKGRKYAVLSDLELDRGKKQADVDRVLSYTHYQQKAANKKRSPLRTIDVLYEVLKDLNIRSLTIPAYFPVSLADQLRQRKIKVAINQDSFFPKRRCKTPTEVKHITQTIRYVDKAIDRAVKFLRKTKIKGPYLWHQGKKVTPQDIKKIINVSLMEDNCVAQHTIIAGGDEACDPHNTGKKPLLAHKPIVMDIFPKSIDTGYYADISRTVVRGKPSKALKQLYQAVLEAQKIGLRMVGPGVNGRDVHQAICHYFENKGYRTGVKKGFIQGFFHGTGHGLGLDVHEPPRIGHANDILRPGDVVTVEPGLYYRGLGGIRIEDDVLITSSGAKVLSHTPKVFEINP